MVIHGWNTESVRMLLYQDKRPGAYAAADDAPPNIGVFDDHTDNPGCRAKRSVPIPRLVREETHERVRPRVLLSRAILYLVSLHLFDSSAVSYSPFRSSESLVVSRSDGNLSLLQQDGMGSMDVGDEWKSHDYEPWIAAFDYWDTNVLYSGT